MTNYMSVYVRKSERESVGGGGMCVSGMTKKERAIDGERRVRARERQKGRERERERERERFTQYT